MISYWYIPATGTMKEVEIKQCHEGNVQEAIADLCQQVQGTMTLWPNEHFELDHFHLFNVTPEQFQVEIAREQHRKPLRQDLRYRCYTIVREQVETLHSDAEDLSTEEMTRRRDVRAAYSRAVDHFHPVNEFLSSFLPHLGRGVRGPAIIFQLTDQLEDVNAAWEVTLSNTNPKKLVILLRTDDTLKKYHQEQAAIRHLGYQ